MVLFRRWSRFAGQARTVVIALSLFGSVAEIAVAQADCGKYTLYDSDPDRGSWIPTQ